VSLLTLYILSFKTDYFQTYRYESSNTISYSMGVARTGSSYGRATGAIWFNNVMCLGTETDIQHCPLNRVHSCGHYEDAGVVCSSSVTPSRGSLTTPPRGSLKNQ